MHSATQHLAGMPTTSKDPNLPPDKGWQAAWALPASRSPPAMPTPSFCQVTSGRGTPVASQDSTALVLAITISILGRGFKAGGSVSGREALPTGDPPRWAKAQGAGALGAMCTVHREPEVFSGCARSAPRRAGVAASMCWQRLPDLQGP